MIGLAAIAAAAGRFVGAMLDECGPKIVDILETAIRRAFSDSIEEGARRPELVRRLGDRVFESFGRRAGGGASEDPGDSAIRKGLGR